MTIDGKYYSEPELMAKFRQMQETIDRYEAENRKLTEEKEELGGLYNDASLGIGYLEQRCEELEKDNLKLESRCTDLQLAYNNEMTDLKLAKRLLKAAIEDSKAVGCANACERCAKIEEDFFKCHGNYKWRYEDDALGLIGEEEEDGTENDS